MAQAEVPPGLQMVGGHMPLIDVADFLRGEPSALDRIAAALRYACEHVGFYFLAGHGIPDGMVADTFAAAKQFHDQSLDAKMALKANAENVGYMPMKGSITRSSAVNNNTKPNLNEAYFLKRETPEEAARAGRPAIAINGRRTCRASATGHWPTCPPWKAWAAAWCRSTSGR